jgi:chromosomal replication initiation ATPase DnaA
MTTTISRLTTLGLIGEARTIAENCGVTLDEMLGRGRYKSMCEARHELWRLTRERFGYSYPQVAKLYGVDHTTVMAALKGKQ